MSTIGLTHRDAVRGFQPDEEDVIAVLTPIPKNYSSDDELKLGITEKLVLTHPTEKSVFLPIHPITKIDLTMPNRLDSVTYLYTFRTKYSKHVFQDEDFVKTIYKLFQQTAEEKGFEIICCGIATDHVHIIIRHDKRHRCGWVMKCIKGASARRFFLRYPGVKMDLRSNSLWTPKYDRRYLAVGEDVERAVCYIEGQWMSDGLDNRYRDGLELKVSGVGVDGMPTFSRVFRPNFHGGAI